MDWAGVELCRAGKKARLREPSAGSTRGVESCLVRSEAGDVGDSARLSAIASRQRGVFSTIQARAAGFDKGAVRRRVSDGSWLRLDHSVIAFASSTPSWERQLAASVVSRPRAVVAHRSAAHLLGLAGFKKGRPVILVPSGTNTRSDLARIIETDQLDEIATTTIEGFRVTTMPETLLSLAADLDRETLEAAFDEALLSSRLDLGAMKDILDREAGRRTRGIRSIRDLTRSRLPSAPTKGSSYLEALLTRILVDADVAGWVREYPMALGDRRVRIDVYIDATRLVIEADGRNWHMRRRDFEADRRRDNALAAMGIQVLRYTFRMLETEPVRCADEIMSVVALRKSQFLEPARSRV